MTVIEGDEPGQKPWTRRKTYGLVFGILYAGVLVTALFPVSLSDSSGLRVQAVVKCGAAIKAALDVGLDEACAQAGRARIANTVRLLLLAVPFGVAYVAACARERND
jgi:hypothetical protein